MSIIKTECFSGADAAHGSGATYGYVKPVTVRSGISGATVVDMPQPARVAGAGRGAVTREPPSQSPVDKTVSIEPDDVAVAGTVQEARSVDASEPWAAGLSLTLAGMFSEQEVEDGFGHPAEIYLEQTLRQIPQASKWCEWAISSRDLRWRASLLRVLGRVSSSLTLPWGYDVVAVALVDRDPEMRDAAIRALEKWGGQRAIDLLSGYQDSITWLAEYASQVIVDLRA